MAEKINTVIPEDIPKIRSILDRIGMDPCTKPERLGGMTNHSYLVTSSDGDKIVVRIPGEGTEQMINRRDERISTELACRLGIDSELLYFDDEGYKVMKYIEAVSLDESVMRLEDNICKEAEVFRRLHTCGVNTGVSFDVFEMAELYESIIRDNGTNTYDDYRDVKEQIISIKNSIDEVSPVSPVPCHNDSLIGNWVMDGNGRLYLIDWEYSGMNDPMWDLACQSIEMDFSDENDNSLLVAYYGREPDLFEKKKFNAAKLYVDYLWTLWGLTRVAYDGIFMQEYADGRYERLKKNLNRMRSLM